MIKLNYIQEYILLAETLNFSKTAEMSYITQPALSRHILVLEEEMGTKLLLRTTRNVQLTPAGEMVYEAFCSMMKLYNRAKENAQTFPEQPIGKLIINSPYYWTGDYTEPLLLKFKELQSKCELSIRSCQPADGLAGLENNKCDLYISMDMPKISANIQKYSFAQEELRVFMTLNHSLAQKETIEMADFHNEIYIYLKEFEDWKNYFIENFASKGIFPSEVACCEQVDSLGMLFQQKNGLCILPYSTRHIDRPYLVCRPFKEPLFIDMYIYYRRDSLNPMVPIFLNAIQSLHS